MAVGALKETGNELFFRMVQLMLHLRCHHTPISLFKPVALHNYADTVHKGPSNRVAVSSYFLQLKTRKQLVYKTLWFSLNELGRRKKSNQRSTGWRKLHQTEPNRS